MLDLKDISIWRGQLKMLSSHMRPVATILSSIALDFVIDKKRWIWKQQKKKISYKAQSIDGLQHPLRAFLWWSDAQAHRNLHPLLTYHLYEWTIKRKSQVKVHYLSFNWLYPNLESKVKVEMGDKRMFWLPQKKKLVQQKPHMSTQTQFWTC